MRKKTKYTNILIVLGILFMLVLFLTASFAYFAITSVNNGVATTVTGKGDEIGTPTLTTNTPSLGINLTGDMMLEEKVGYKYYATPTSEGIGISPSESPSLNNGRYILATATLDRGIALDCTFTYDIKATSKSSLGTDGDNVYVIITDGSGTSTTYTLTQLISGVTYKGNIVNLKSGANQAIYVESYVENMENPQLSLIGNTYTISMTPKSGTQGFSCNVSETKTADMMVVAADKYKLWNSGLEGDGYRFIGTGSLCLYGDGEHFETINTDGTCPVLYSYIRTNLKYNIQETYNYQTSCPANTSQFTYDCTQYESVKTDNPMNNYVCFGTNSKSECISNPDKYMYRIIGTFQEENGDGTVNESSSYHFKLIKDNVLPEMYKWNGDYTTDVSWEKSDLYKGINGGYFLTNTDYDYMQNNNWLKKIKNWKWPILKTGDNVDSNIFYNNTAESGYLYEMNRKNKTITTGSWNYVDSIIGLMTGSDYLLSLGLDLLNKSQNETVDNTSVYRLYKKSWLSNNALQWTSTRRGKDALYYYAFNIITDGRFITGSVNTTKTVRPAFYLTSDSMLISGTGTEVDPYILNS